MASERPGIRRPDHVLVRELEGEAVLLNLETETYFGLDEIGTRVWNELAAGVSIDGACAALLREFEVEPHVLRGDVEKLVSELLARGLLEPTPADAVPDGPPGEAAAPTQQFLRSVP